MKLKLSLLLIPLLLTACKQPKESDPILVIAPMECEHTTIYQELVNKKDKTIGNYTFTKGYINNYPVVLVRSLIGMVNSAVATTIGIEHYHPRSIITQGTSGAHNPNLHAGDIVLGENILEIGNYKTSHENEGDGYSMDNREYPGEEMLIDGEIIRVTTFHSTESLLNLAYSISYSEGSVYKGTIASGDIWNREVDMIKHYREIFNTDCEEMEGFAVAQVAYQFDIDYLCIRIISNSEYYNDEVFNSDAGEICQQYTIDVIKGMINQYNNQK